MKGLFHDFILSTEAEINEFVNSFHTNNYEDFLSNKIRIQIHDDFIQIMLSKRYLVSVYCYDYKNKEVISGLCSTGCSIFHVDQLDLLYEKIDLFKKEIDTDPETIKGMKIFNRPKEEVLKNCNELQKVILKAKENNLCIYHYGI